MTDAVRLYVRYASISARSQMQYRASFVMETIGQFGALGTEFIGILVLFSRFDTLEGWSLAEVAFLYSLVHLGFAFADTFTRIHRFIQVDGVRTAEGCEGVTGAIIRACIRVGGRSPGGLQALLGAPMKVCDGPGGAS